MGRSPKARQAAAAIVCCSCESYDGRCVSFSLPPVIEEIPCGLAESGCGVSPDTTHRLSATWVDGESVDHPDDQYKHSSYT